jgi:hypothetical protein
MNIIKNFDTPDEAQEFVENFAGSTSAELHSVQIAGTYPDGVFTRTIYFGPIKIAQNNQALHALFDGFNAIYGGKR